MKSLISRFAFSLIEMVVVIAIVSLLAAIAVPSYSAYVDKARISRLVSLADAYWQLFADYYEVHGKLPLLSQIVPGYSATEYGYAAFVLPGWTNDIVASDIWLQTNLYEVNPIYPAFYITIQMNKINDSRINHHAFIMTGHLENGAWVKHCGQWNTSNPGYYVDATYMPETCNETPVQILPEYF